MNIKLQYLFDMFNLIIEFILILFDNLFEFLNF